MMVASTRIGDFWVYSMAVKFLASIRIDLENRQLHNSIRVWIELSCLNIDKRNWSFQLTVLQQSLFIKCECVGVNVNHD